MRGEETKETQTEIQDTNQEDQQQAKATEPKGRRSGNEDFDPRLLRNPTSRYERMLRLYLTGSAEVILLTDEALTGVNESEARRPRNIDPNSDLSTINDNDDFWEQYDSLAEDKKPEHMKRFCRAVEARHAREEAARQAAQEERHRNWFARRQPMAGPSGEQGRATKRKRSFVDDDDESEEEEARERTKKNKTTECEWRDPQNESSDSSDNGSSEE